MFGTLVYLFASSRCDGVASLASCRWRHWHHVDFLSSFPRERCPCEGDRMTRSCTKNLVCLKASSAGRQTLLRRSGCRLGGELEALAISSPKKKQQSLTASFALHTGAQQSAPDCCSSRAHPREYTKTKPRGRSRYTSTHEASRNKSRGRADRTLVLGRRGAAAQNAGGRPGLPLTAPDTRRFQPTPHGRRTRPPPREKRTSTNHPRDERTKGPRAGVWTPSDGRVKRTHMQTFTRAEGFPFETCRERIPPRA